MKPKLTVLDGGIESLFKRAAEAFVDGDQELLKQIHEELERLARERGQAEAEIIRRTIAQQKLGQKR